MVDVAQLVRVPDCGSEGRGFEPHLPPQKQTQGFYLAFFCCMRFPSASSRKLLHQKRAFCALLLFVRGSVVVGCEDKRDIYFQRYPRFGFAVRTPSSTPKRSKKVSISRHLLFLLLIKTKVLCNNILPSLVVPLRRADGEGVMRSEHRFA